MSSMTTPEIIARLETLISAVNIRPCRREVTFKPPSVSIESCRRLNANPKPAEEHSYCDECLLQWKLVQAERLARNVLSIEREEQWEREANLSKQTRPPSRSAV